MDATLHSPQKNIGDIVNYSSYDALFHHIYNDHPAEALNLFMSLSYQELDIDTKTRAKRILIGLEK